MALSDATAGGTWSSSNAAVASVSISGNVTGISAGTVTITYTVGSCYVTHAVTVATSSISGPASVCVGSSIALTDPVPGGTWSSSNPATGSVDASGNVTGVAAGVVTITYAVGSCTATANITVNPLPAAIYGSSYGCTGMTLLLTDGTAGGTWSSSNPGVGSIDASGNVTGITAGTTTITYTLGTGCYTTWAFPVYASPDPISGSSSVCVGSSISLSDATSGGTWSSDNTSVATVDASGDVTGITTGTANIYYTNVIGCSAILNITVNPLPASIAGPTLVCTLSVINALDGSPGGTWSSSDPTLGSIDPSTGIITGISPGIITITYTLPTGCIATETVSVDAYAGNISGPADFCNGITVTFTSDGDAGGTWSSTDPTVSVNPLTGGVTGVSAGSATITYTVTNTCGTSVSTFSTSVDPVPAAITGGPAVICYNHGQQAFLADAVTGGVWSSSNNSIATVGTSGVVTGYAPGNVIIFYGFGSCVKKFPLQSDLCIPRPGNTAGPQSEQACNLYPNPNKGDFMIKGNLGTDADQPVVVEITDLLGQVVYTSGFTAVKGTLNENISLGNVANGMYLVIVHSGADNHVFHVVIQR